MASRLHNFLAAHVSQLIDPLAEFRAVDVLRDQVGDVRLDAFFELRLLVVGYGHQPHRLRRCDHRHRIGRGKFKVADGLGHSFGRHGHSSH